MTARQLRSGALAEQVRAALEASGLPAESLLIELPEAALRQLPEPLGQALAEITAQRRAPERRRLRHRLRLAAHAAAPARQRGLHRPQPDRRRARTTAERAGLARALIALARGLDFEVVAKGVETQAQRDFLAEAGCRVCQGELFAPAAPRARGRALPARAPRRLGSSQPPRGDENALQLVEKRVRAAHELRRVDVGGRIHDACGQRRQALRRRWSGRCP